MVEVSNNKKSWESKREIKRYRGDAHASRQHPEIVIRGEDHWNAVLNMDKARYIRMQVDLGVPKKALAREFKVNPSLIRQVCRGDIWKED